MAASGFAPDLLEGQVALVTGGATGIGKEICRVLGAHGARVTRASRKQENPAEAVRELRSQGVDATSGVCDVREAGAVRAGVDSPTRSGAVEWGPYGIRVNASAPGSIGGTEGLRRFASLTQCLCGPMARFVSGQVIAVDGAGSADLLKLRAGRI